MDSAVSLSLKEIVRMFSRGFTVCGRVLFVLGLLGVGIGGASRDASAQDLNSIGPIVGNVVSMETVHDSSTGLYSKVALTLDSRCKDIAGTTVCSSSPFHVVVECHSSAQPDCRSRFVTGYGLVGEYLAFWGCPNVVQTKYEVVGTTITEVRTCQGGFGACASAEGWVGSSGRLIVDTWYAQAAYPSPYCTAK